MVEGSQKVSKRHAEIIDSLAALPPRKKVKGVSLELDAQKKFQEEGLAPLKSATVRSRLRASSAKQGIPNRNKIVTEAHVRILREIVEKNCGGKDLFQVASKRFEEAGLEKLTAFTFRKHLKYLGYATAEQQEVNDLGEESSDGTSNNCPSSGETEDLSKKATEMSPENLPNKDILLEFLSSKRINFCHDKELLWNEVSQEFENRGLKRVARNTLWKHLKMNSADLSQKTDDEDITAEDVADAAGGLLLLRDRAQQFCI